MPLAKSVPQTTTEIQPSKQPEPQILISPGEEKVHVELFRYFNINPIDGSDQLKEVYDWAKGEDSSVSDVLRKIRSLENKLGAPAIGETRLNKLYNWVRISKQINDTTGRMDNEIKNITKKSEQEIERLKQSHIPELEKLNKQIEEKKSSLNRAIKLYKLNANEQAKNIKERHIRELKD